MSGKVNRWLGGWALIILGLGLAIFEYVQWQSPEPWFRVPTFFGSHPLIYIAIGIVCGMAEIAISRFVSNPKWKSGLPGTIAIVIPSTMLVFFSSDPLMIGAIGIYAVTIGVASFFNVGPIRTGEGDGSRFLGNES